MATQPDSSAGNLTGIGGVPNKQFSADGRRRKISHTEAVAAVCPACQFVHDGLYTMVICCGEVTVSV